MHAAPECRSVRWVLPYTSVTSFVSAAATANGRGLSRLSPVVLRLIQTTWPGLTRSERGGLAGSLSCLMRTHLAQCE